MWTEDVRTISPRILVWLFGLVHAHGKVNPRETEQVDLELIDSYPGVAKSV